MFLACQAPGEEILDFYASLIPADRRASARSRFRLVVVPDDSSWSIAAKLLDRPDLLEELRRSFAGRPVFLEPWNVTDAEVEVAVALPAPINGTAPDLWPLGFKSAGRRLFVEAGVPVPVGAEGVGSVEEVVELVAGVRFSSPSVQVDISPPVRQRCCRPTSSCSAARTARCMSAAGSQLIRPMPASWPALAGPSASGWPAAVWSGA